MFSSVLHIKAHIPIPQKAIVIAITAAIGIATILRKKIVLKRICRDNIPV